MKLIGNKKIEAVPVISVICVFLIGSALTGASSLQVRRDGDLDRLEVNHDRGAGVLFKATTHSSFTGQGHWPADSCDHRRLRGYPPE
jgi:hypothetical protein